MNPTTSSRRRRDDFAPTEPVPTAEEGSHESDDSDEAEQDTSEEEQDKGSYGDSDGYYYGYGYLVVTTGPELPIDS